MTIRSANRPGRVVLASVLSIAASFLASALYGADVEQTTPPAAATFGYVANTVDNTVSVIATASNTVVATIPVGQVPNWVAITPDGTHAYVTNFCGPAPCAASEFTVSVIDRRQ